MEPTPDALNLDETREIPVSFGGRTFALTQQRRAILMRIVNFIHTNGESEGKKPKEGASDVEVMETHFENSLPLVALMFGYEKKDDETKAVIEFLREHLTHPKALKIFKAWWELNEIDDFFIRRGNMLMDPDIAQWMKTQRRAVTQEPLASIPTT